MLFHGGGGGGGKKASVLDRFFLLSTFLDSKLVAPTGTDFRISLNACTTDYLLSEDLISASYVFFWSSLWFSGA